MNNKTKIIGTILVLALLIFSTMCVSAETVITQDVSGFTAWWNNLVHSSSTFAIVGNDQQCGILPGGTPNYEWAVAPNQNFWSGTLAPRDELLNNRPSSFNSICANPIMDIFTNGWTPYVETKSMVTYSAGSGGATIQIYCCPHPEPTSQSQCDSWNLGTYQPITCPTWSGTSFYKCTNAAGQTENRLPYYSSSYKYCELTSAKKCYYKPLSSSTCAYYSFPGATSCSQVGSPLGFSNGQPLFDTQSACDSSTSCQNQCSLNSKQCSGTGYQTCTLQNGCYNWNSVTACASGQTCSNGVCGSGTAPTCIDTQMLISGSCVEKNTICTADGGTKDCSTTPTVIDPTINAKITQIELLDANGNQFTRTPEPGQQVTVKITVRDTVENFQQKGMIASVIQNGVVKGALQQVVGLANSEVYLVEAGVVPYSVAKDWAFPDLQIFSVYNLFATTPTLQTECCVGQTNVGAVKAQWYATGMLINGIITSFKDLAGRRTTSDDIVEIQTTLTMNIPDKTVVDQCPVNGVSTPYWNANDSKYVAYAVIMNDCRFREGIETGYSNSISKTKVFDINLNASSGGSGLKDAGESCTVNGECKSGSCESTGGILGFFASLKCSEGAGLITTESFTLTTLKKVSLTKEEINTATNLMRFASSCYDSNECLGRENSTVSCVSLASLEEDGTIATEGAVASLMDYGKGIVVGGTAGSLGGAAAGVYLCQAGVFASQVAVITTFPEVSAALREAKLVTSSGTISKNAATLLAHSGSVATTSSTASAFTCATIGAYAGGAIGSLFGSWLISLDKNADPLTKAFNVKDSSSIGICTAVQESPFSKYTSWAAFFPITGDKGTDGLIIIFGGIVLLALLFRK